MSKLIFNATASLKALQPTWQDGTVYDIDAMEAKRLLKSFPDNFEKYDPKKHLLQPETADHADDDDNGGNASQSIALEDVLTTNDNLLNLLLDQGVTTLAEAKTLTGKDLKKMGIHKSQIDAVLETLAALKPDSDRSEPEPDSNK